MRGTLDLLGKIFLFRSCEGSEPGRRSGSPCLDYYIKRCGAPCVGYVSKEEYRAGIDGVIAFLSGRFRQIERELEDRMFFAAGQQDYEQATIERNRLQSVRALLERQRVADDRAGTYDAVAVAVDGDGGQRAGLPGPRRRALRPPVLLPRQRGRVRRRARGRGVPAPVLRERDVDPGADRRAGRARRRLRARRARRDAGRAPQRAGRDPRRRARRQAPHPRPRRAQRAARARPGEAALRAPPPAARGGARRAPERARARRAARAHRVLRHLQHRRHAHGRLDGRLRGRRAEEVRLPPLHHSHRRRQRRFRLDGRGAAAGATRSGRSRRSARPTTPSATPRSPRCPTSS